MLKGRNARSIHCNVLSFIFAFNCCLQPAQNPNLELSHTLLKAAEAAASGASATGKASGGSALAAPFQARRVSGILRCSVFGTNGLRGQAHRRKKRKSRTAASPRKVRRLRLRRIPWGRARGLRTPALPAGWGRPAAAPPPPPPPPPPPSRSSTRKSRQRLRSLPERRRAAAGDQLFQFLLVFNFLNFILKLLFYPLLKRSLFAVCEFSSCGRCRPGWGTAVPEERWAAAGERRPGAGCEPRQHRRQQQVPGRAPGGVRSPSPRGRKGRCRAGTWPNPAPGLESRAHRSGSRPRLLPAARF